ncbi:translocase of outer mitochondrial membrane [Sorochytrium milnesiophthora]
MTELLDSVRSHFAGIRKRLDLKPPGTFELLHREARGVFTTNYAFDGAKFDFGKGLSQNFQITHSFQLGSATTPPNYSFGAVVAEGNNFMHGQVDSEGNMNGRMSYALSKELLAKCNLQMGSEPGHSMLQVEGDYTGEDFHFNLKALNPSPLDGTGIFMASYLQSVSSSLALGVEGLLQRPMEDMEESGLSFVAKYTLPRHIMTPPASLAPTDPIPQQPTAHPVLTATLQSFGALHLSYVHPVSSKLDLATEVQLLATPRGREGTASVGAKFDFRAATMRAMIDTSGRISAVLEEKMAPGFSFLLSGELDHLKGTSRFGVGLQLDM